MVYKYILLSFTCESVGLKCRTNRSVTKQHILSLNQHEFNFNYYYCLRMNKRNKQLKLFSSAKQHGVRTEVVLCRWRSRALSANNRFVGEIKRLARLLVLIIYFGLHSRSRRLLIGWPRKKKPILILSRARFGGLRSYTRTFVVGKKDIRARPEFPRWSLPFEHRIVSDDSHEKRVYTFGDFSWFPT